MVNIKQLSVIWKFEKFVASLQHRTDYSDGNFEYKENLKK